MLTRYKKITLTTIFILITACNSTVPAALRLHLDRSVVYVIGLVAAFLVFKDRMIATDPAR